MSTHSYSQQCPHCYAEDSLMVCDDTRPPSSDAICIECGYGYRTVHEIYDLEYVNWQRESQDLPEIKSLPKHDGMKHYVTSNGSQIQ